MLKKKVLIIDDDPTIRKLTERLFTRAGAQVLTAENGEEGLRHFYIFQPDLVILDIMMPDGNGFDICRGIRRLSDVPVIMLTALHQDKEVVRGLEAGADDFVTKPFSQAVLLARARVVLRRAESVHSPGKPVQYQDERLKIDLEEHRVMVDGRAVKLTPTEYRLLAFLVQNAGKVLTFQQILENVWGWEYGDSVDYVHVYVSHLRQKLEEDPRQPRRILTEYGMGYRFEKAN